MRLLLKKMTREELVDLLWFMFFNPITFLRGYRPYWYLKKYKQWRRIDSYAERVDWNDLESIWRIVE